MAGRDLTTALPTEIVRRFFWGWTFDDLRSLLGVCTRWRAIGLDLPIYWRSIMFSDSKYSAVSLALLRIERTRGRLFSLEILALRDKEPLYQMLSVLPSCLDRITTLVLFVPGVHAAAAFGALLQPAPKLEAVHLEFQPVDPELKEPIVPSDLFAHHAPALRRVRLYGVRLVEPLAIFQRVTDVCLTLRSDELPVVPCAFTHFPSTRRLRLLMCAALSHSQHVPNSFWSALDTLTLVGTPEGLSSAIQDLPVFAIRNVMAYPGSSQFDRLCSLLYGDLDLALLSDHDFDSDDHVGMFVLHLTERSTQRRRMFADHWCWWEEGTSLPNLYDLLRFNIAERVVALSISADILPAACSRFPQLPNVAEITVMFHYWGFSRATPVQPLVVPKLRSLKLHGHDELPTVPASFLRDICIHALTGYVAPLVVTVERVIIPRHGDTLESISEVVLLN